MSAGRRIGSLFAATVLFAVFAVPSGCAGGAVASDGAGGGGTSTSNGTGGGLGLGPMLGSSTDPLTCADAAGSRSYLGCDFWPTVTFNQVWPIFDFAIVVANVGADPSELTVSGPSGVVTTTTVQPLDLVTIALPWDDALKGPSSDTCGHTTSPAGSVLAKHSAYHLTSTRPVIAYQFNALEYRGAGGPSGKDWSTCPGLQNCMFGDGTMHPIGCFSFSNDASILLPTSAMTGNYRIPALDDAGGSVFVTITATEDATTLKVGLGKNANVLAGGPVAATAGGKSIPLMLNAGDVIELASDGVSDFGGTLVTADKAVQVLTGASCASIPYDKVKGYTCDHLEESVQPAETLGKHYVLAPPTGPLGTPTPYRVRLFGNVDGTTLTYPSGKPAGAPSTLDAGMVADLGVISDAIEIVGDHEIEVATFLVSSGIADPNDFEPHGDPSQTFAVAVEQFRKSYVFLAPQDYDVNFVDVIAPTGASITLDGAPIPGASAPLGSAGFGVSRVRLGAGHGGAHSLTSDTAIGVQVIGYGAYTSYEYPAGLDLAQIAPPPPK